MAQSEDISLPLPLEAESNVPEIAERIMHAAIKLFGRKGYSATSVREIVQEANVTNPMLYYYFDSKEGLFRRLMEFLFEHMRLRIEEISKSDALGIEERVRAVVSSHLEGVRDHPEILRFIYSAIFGPRESRPDIDVHAMHMRTHSIVQEMFDEAITSGEFIPANDQLTACDLAEFLLGMINQDLMRILTILELEPDGEDYALLTEQLTGEAATERITALFFGGVGTIQKEAKS